MKSAIWLHLLALSLSGCANMFYGPADLALLPPQFHDPLHGVGGSFKAELLRSAPVSCLSFNAPYDNKTKLIVSKKLLEQLIVMGNTAPWEKTNGRWNSGLAARAKKILVEAGSEIDQYGCLDVGKRVDWHTQDVKFLGMTLFQSGQIAVAKDGFPDFVPYVKVSYSGTMGYRGHITVRLPPEYGDREIINDLWWVS